MGVSQAALIHPHFSAPVAFTGAARRSTEMRSQNGANVEEGRSKCAFWPCRLRWCTIFDPVTFDWVVSKVGGQAGRRARFIADPIEPLPLPTRSKACAMLGLATLLQPANTLG
jgi:hypothetical protein